MRELQLNQVLELLRQYLGMDSWIANGFIKNIEPMEENNPTLCIDKTGTIYYNPKFWKKEINTPNKVIEAIMHELFHKVLGDFNRGDITLVRNFSSDIVINCMVKTILGHSDLFESMYSQQMPEGLLRPGSQYRKTKYEKLYEEVWGHSMAASCANNMGNVYDAVNILLPKKKYKIIFIGSHGEGTDSGSGDDNDGVELDLGPDAKSQLAKELAEQCEKHAGIGADLLSDVIKVLKSRCSLKHTLLREFGIDNHINKIRSYYETKHITRSVVPRNPCRRDIALLSSGIYPVFWNNEINKYQLNNQGIVFYLDVSGSMWKDLPKILGVLQNFQSNIEKIYQFSNKIAETTLSELVKGKIDSTGGTDFNCIVKHAVDNNFAKIIIITDGYGDVSDKDLRNQAIQHIKKACVIYTDKHISKSHFFEQTYHKSYYLDDIIHKRT